MTIKERITKMLIDSPNLRSNKKFVIGKIWKEECDYKGITTIDEFISAMALGQLTNPETIRRQILKIREEYPELRPTPEEMEQNRVLEGILRQNRGEFPR